ncbi:hypothetical protein BLNAU_416 [Blattamonas nauphoetae]|uniref:Uncharacterized protein n=1 Tax=Blattamonas nauphoetae TaxID=2049346 RepID=A0ABQ9YL67_9EUKA|nr:hypothetical protein BLNAU_416 [Blattamonas nauphoetae]
MTEEEQVNEQAPVDEVQEMQKVIDKLVKSIDKYAKNGQYLQADNAQKQLASAKKQLNEKKKTAIQTKHKTEKGDLRAAHDFLLVKFNELWDQQIQVFLKDAQKQQHALEKRQFKEQAELEQQLEDHKGQEPKFSVQLSTLRKSEIHLAMEKKFQEAHKAKVAADELEAKERAQFAFEEEKRIENLKKQQKALHAQELSTLQRRLEREKRELMDQKKNDSGLLDQKYQNSLRETESKQKNEMIQFEKSIAAEPEVKIKIEDPSKSKNTESKKPLKTESTQKKQDTPGKTGKFSDMISTRPTPGNRQ